MDNRIIKYVVIENVTEAFVESLRAAGAHLSVHDELPTIEVLKEVEAPIPELAAKIIALINDEVQKESAKVADRYLVQGHGAVVRGPIQLPQGHFHQLLRRHRHLIPASSRRWR